MAVSDRSKPLTATGDYQLRFDSNALDDLWIVMGWSASG